MLINCPRCGFQQPKDQYCAQCGIDMEAFVPAKTPLLKKIFGSLLVQLFILIAIIGGVGATLFSTKESLLLKARNPNKTSVQVSSSQSNLNSQDQFETLAADDGEQVETNSNEATPPPTAPEGSINAFKVASPNSQEGGEKAKPAAAAGAGQLIVYYAEISREALASLFNNSRATGQFMEFPDYSAGLIPNIQKVIGSPQVKVLHKEIKPLESSKNLHWFFGIKNPTDSVNEIGLTTVLEIGDIENGLLHGSLEIQRTWKEPSSAGNLEIQKKAFPAEFEVDAESGFFMSGVMPRRSYLDNEKELTNINIYKVFSSAQFKSGESHFVILIDFEK